MTTTSGNLLYIHVTSIHEAGHAVAAMREGRHVSYVGVSSEDPGNGICSSQVKPTNPYEVIASPGSAKAAWGQTIKTTLADIRIHLAGPLAEARALNKPLRSIGAQSDLDKCLNKANRLLNLYDFISEFTHVDPVDPFELLEQQRKRTRQWLSQPRVWKQVIQLAKILSHVNLLKNTDVRRAISTTRIHNKQLPFILD